MRSLGLTEKTSMIFVMFYSSCPWHPKLDHTVLFRVLINSAENDKRSEQGRRCTSSPCPWCRSRTPSRSAPTSRLASWSTDRLSRRDPCGPYHEPSHRHKWRLEQMVCRETVHFNINTIPTENSGLEIDTGEDFFMWDCHVRSLFYVISSGWYSNINIRVDVYDF